MKHGKKALKSPKLEQKLVKIEEIEDVPEIRISLCCHGKRVFSPSQKANGILGNKLF